MMMEGEMAGGVEEQPTQFLSLQADDLEALMNFLEPHSKISFRKNGLLLFTELLFLCRCSRCGSSNLFIVQIIQIL